MIKTIIFLFGLFAITCAFAAEEKGTFELTIENIQKDKGGKLVFYLYRGEDAWLEKEKALVKKEIEVKDGKAQVTFSGLAYRDDYALQVFHDENSNGKIDFRIFPFPKPKEGVAVSNNHSRMGKPKYERAKFKIDQPIVKMTLKLIY